MPALIDPGLAGRTALVTGANQGIGAAVARALGGLGAKVFITSFRMDPDEHAGDPAYPAEYGPVRAQSAEPVVAAIEAAGGTVAAWECDLADPDAPAALFDRAEAAFGPVEILVHCACDWAADTFQPAAADRFGRSLTAVTAATYERLFSVTARATALLIAEFARRHLARDASWGRIVTITTGGESGFPEEVSYGASKRALESYTDSAAWELGRYGITANVVCPPATDTGWIMPDLAAAIRDSPPFFRVASPADVAEAVTLLVSEQARWITGQKLTVR